MNPEQFSGVAKIEPGTHVRFRQDGKKLPQPIARRWFHLPDYAGVHRMVSLYDDSTVSLIDSCPDTRLVLGARFDIPMTEVNPFLFSALWANVTCEDREAFELKHADKIKEAAWLLGSE